MPGSPVSRRFVVGLIGGSAAAAPLLARAGSLSPGASEAGRAGDLVASLHPGARLGRWTVRRVEPLTEGAVTLTLAGADPASPEFRLEILARDLSPLAPRPPAATERFAIHVRNGGDGWMPTCEDQGLAAMALAAVLDATERSVTTAGFLTHAERLDQHRASLLPGPGQPSR